jgi:hypothetical protein
MLNLLTEIPALGVDEFFHFASPALSDKDRPKSSLLGIFIIINRFLRDVHAQ